MPARTYDSGDAAFATSTRFGWLPSHCTVYGQLSGNGFLLGPSSRSATSAMPKKFTIAATFGSPGAWQRRSKPSLVRSMPVVRARCPPAGVGEGKGWRQSRRRSRWGRRRSQRVNIGLPFPPIGTHVDDVGNGAHLLEKRDGRLQIRRLGDGGGREQQERQERKDDALH